MKLSIQLIVLSCFLAISIVSMAQRIQSSCVAPDSIVAKYRNDANQLTLRYIYRNELKYLDSIRVPDSRSDSLLNALLAIYNFDSLEERDTIFDYFDIRAREAVAMTSIYLKVDTAIQWVRNLKDSVYPVGEPLIDKLFSEYKMKLDTYFPLFQSNEVMLSFKSTDTNLNISPIVKTLQPLTEISIACSNNEWSSGYDIHDSIHSDHIEYVFSIGGFMPGTVSHYFRFKVYSDCSVEFEGKFLRSQPHWVYDRIETYRTCVTNDQIGISESTIGSGLFKVYPNPTTDRLTIASNGFGEYSIYSLTGQKFQEGVLREEEQSLSIEKLPQGTYLIIHNSNNSRSVKKFIKE